MVLLALWLTLASPGFAVIEVPFEFRDGLIWLQVHAAASQPPMTFVLDSGAGGSVIDLACARRLGLRMGKREQVAGVRGVQTAWRVAGLTAEISGGLKTPASLLAMDLAPLRGKAMAKFDGVLGLDFLRQHIVEVDYRAGELRFYQRHEARSSAGERVNLISRNDALCISTTINGAAKVLRLDTGCHSPLELFDDGRPARKNGSPSVALSGAIAPGSTADVQMGSTFCAAVPAGLHRRRFFSGEDGLLGNGLLARFEVTIDAARKTLFLREQPQRL